MAINAPFRAVEIKESRKLLLKMNPGISIPDRKKSAGVLLDEIYDEEKVKLVSSIKGIFSTLSIDDWSNPTNNPVIGVAFCTKGKTYLSDVIDTTGVPHTAENLCDICEAQIKKCEEEWEIKITCLVTDNAANMMKEEIR